ncbi:hypothetical protein [Halalkalicoccus salilacus]|uniref:hypothetical protein n=1 Tax=Halalkalicoccus TaxID=332246 RepID=UPI002F96D693
MPQLLSTDTGFYGAIGVFLIALFLVGVTVLVIRPAGGLESPSLVALVVGYLLFMTSYFLAIAIYNLVPDDA